MIQCIGGCGSTNIMTDGLCDDIECRQKVTKYNVTATHDENPIKMTCVFCGAEIGKSGSCDKIECKEQNLISKIQIHDLRVKNKDKDALDCWSEFCPSNTIRWIKVNLGSNTTYKGVCEKCNILYDIGTTIGGGMVTSKENWKKLMCEKNER